MQSESGHADHTAVMPTVRVRNLIGGAWRDGSSDDLIDVVDPSTGATLASFASSTAADVDDAVAAARSAQPAWAAHTAGERAKLLHRIVSRFEEHFEEFVAVEVADAGKPITATRDEELAGVLDAMRHFAGAARTLAAQAAGEYVSGTTTMIRREPLGVVAGVTPWNYPLWQAVWKIFPAIAVGNTIVLKPAENTPLTATMFAELASEYLPDGVLNIVHGLGATVGQALSTHPGIDLLSFTGSTATGRAIAHAAAGHPIKAVLELGGNSPVIVTPDADIPDAVETITASGLFNAGQECMAATRVIVHESIAKEFTQRLVESVAAVVIGDTTDEKTIVGPLISDTQLQRALGLLERVPAHAQVLTGGKRYDRPGFYLQPTVVADLRQDDELIQHEIFAPVITVQKYASLDDAVELANGVEFGLAASVFTRDVAAAMDVTRRLQFGNVWVNTHLVVAPDLPIGGFNQSGYGKEGGLAGIEEFTRLKQVGIKVG